MRPAAKVAGRWTYLYRAMDHHGQVIDVLLSAKRDLAAARRFFARALRAGTVPVEVTTDRAPVYPRVPGFGASGHRTAPSLLRSSSLWPPARCRRRACRTSPA
jgi:transposase-like protein